MAPLIVSSLTPTRLSHRPITPPSSPIGLEPVIQEPVLKDQCLFSCHFNMEYRQLLPSKIIATADVPDVSETDESGGDGSHE